MSFDSLLKKVYVFRAAFLSIFPFVTKRWRGTSRYPVNQSLVELVVDGGHGGGGLRPLAFVGEAKVTLRGAAGAAAASAAAATSAGRTANATAPLGCVPHGSAAAVGRGGRPLLLGPPGVCGIGAA